MINPQENLVKVEDIAQYLQVSKSFVYKLVQEQKIPYYKVPKTYRFKMSEVRAVIEKGMKYA